MSVSNCSRPEIVGPFRGFLHLLQSLTHCFIYKQAPELTPWALSAFYSLRFPKIQNLKTTWLMPGSSSSIIMLLTSILALWYVWRVNCSHLQTGIIATWYNSSNVGKDELYSKTQANSYHTYVGANSYHTHSVTIVSLQRCSSSLDYLWSWYRRPWWGCRLWSRWIFKIRCISYGYLSMTNIAIWVLQLLNICMTHEWPKLPLSC